MGVVASSPCNEIVDIDHNPFRAMTPNDVLKLVDTHGFAVISSDVSLSVWQDLATTLMHTARRSTRGQGRWCLNDKANKDLEGFKKMYTSPVLIECLDALTLHGCGSTCWSIGKSGGDVVEPHVDLWQDIHSDWYAYRMCSMVYGYALCVSVAPCDIPWNFGPIRAYSWSHTQYYVSPEDETDAMKYSAMIPLKAGDFLIRDVRAAHAGCPNRRDTCRVLPGFQVVSPLWSEVEANMHE